MNPCGEIIDFGVTQGVSRCRPYSNSDREVWIRWYTAQPDAQAFPGWTWSGSPLWEPRRNEFDGPGVFFGGARQRRPQFSFFPGDHFSGTLDQFADGLLDPAGAVGPNVCNLPWIASAGGVVLGGTAWGSAVARGSLAQVQRLPGRVSDRLDAVGSLHQVQTLPGVTAVGVRVVGGLSQCQSLGGAVWVGSAVSGLLSQSQRLTGTIATTVVSSGLANVAVMATGSTSVVVSSAGTAAVACGASGSTSTTTTVRGSLAQVQTLLGLTPTGVGVQGSLSQVQTLGGDASGSSGPVAPITTGCSACPGGCFITWTAPAVSGISGGGCAGYNTTITLVYSGTGCQWNSVEEWGAGRPKWIMTLTSGPNAQLNATGSGGAIDAIYVLTGSWACLGATNTLSFLTATNCAGWPATLTLSSS